MSRRGGYASAFSGSGSIADAPGVRGPAHRRAFYPPRSDAFSETILGAPVDLVRVVKEFGFEGILAKRADSIYESVKRSGAWFKYRINKGQEFVIGDYVPGNPLDSIIVGYYEGEKLLYRCQGEKRLRPEHPSGGGDQIHWPKNRHLPVLKSTGKETHAMGVDERRDEKLSLAQTGMMVTVQRFNSSTVQGPPDPSP